MKNNKWIILVAFCVAMGKLPADGNIMIDHDLKIEIIEYLAPKCAESLPMVPLVDYVEGDTNQLLRILSTIIHTNNEWYCSRSMSEYGKYAGVSELPFLYSCATNPVCGWITLDAIFRIEGVSSNSLFAVKQYLSIATGFSENNNWERARFAKNFIKMIYGSDKFSEYRNEAFGMVYDFGRNINIMHVTIDKSLMSADDTYKNSKRRLDAMRNSRSRCISDFLTNYVEGVIKELEKYPEEKLAD